MQLHGRFLILFHNMDVCDEGSTLFQRLKHLWLQSPQMLLYCALRLDNYSPHSPSRTVSLSLISFKDDYFNNLTQETRKTTEVAPKVQLIKANSRAKPSIPRHLR